MKEKFIFEIIEIERNDHCLFANTAARDRVSHEHTELVL